MAVEYSVAKLKVERDLDLQDEVFISAEEMLGYFNEAKRRAAGLVVTIYEDYFLTKGYLALVNGTSLYDLPDGIFANKIRAIVYNSSSIKYEIKRLRTARQFLERALLRDDNPADYYQYIILNSVADGFQIELSPAARETSSTNVEIWYERDIAEIEGDDDIVDEIPQSINFIYAYVKGRCKQKENAGSMPPDAAAELEQEQRLLVDLLTNKTPDNDNRVELDLGIYEEMS